MARDHGHQSRKVRRSTLSANFEIGALAFWKADFHFKGEMLPRNDAVELHLDDPVVSAWVHRCYSRLRKWHGVLNMVPLCLYRWHENANRSHHSYGATRYGVFGHFNTADYYPYRRHRSYGHYYSSHYSPYYASHYSPYYSAYYSPYYSSYYSVGLGSSYYGSSYYAYPYSSSSVVYYSDNLYDRGYDDYDIDVYGTTNVYIGDGSVGYASPGGDSLSDIQYEQVAPYQESSPPVLEAPPSDPPAVPIEAAPSDQPEAQSSVEPDANQASSAEPFFNRGYRAFVAGNYEEAVERYTDALLAGEERGLSSLMYGVSAFALGEYATAGAAVRRSVLLRPDLIESPIDLRSMYADPMVLDGQLGRLANFVRLNASNRSAKFLLAYLHFAALQPEYTVTLAAELTKADPNDGLAKHLLDQAKRATRESDSASGIDQP
ncbi:hypothetical protein IID23_03940 [Patescibacteria group bacterium]|nr:hypothetical protein [Patescibacteria group bacterium]